MSGSVVEGAAVAVGPDSTRCGCEGCLSAEGLAGVGQDGCARFAFDLCPVSSEVFGAAVGAGFALLAE